MEELLIMTLFAVTAIVIGLVTVFAVKTLGTKRKPKDSALEAWKSVAKEKDIAFVALQKELDRQRGRANRATQQYNELLEEQMEDSNDSMSYEQIKELAKTQGINPVLLDLPMVKDFVEPAIKGKSIGEIKQLLDGAKSLLANKQSESIDSGEFGEFKS